MLTSFVCPIMWHLYVSERLGAAVDPGWSPIRSSQIVALGSMSVLLWYISPGPGMPYFRENE